MTFPPKVWDGVLRRLEGELSPFTVDAWLRPLTPLQLTAVAETAQEQPTLHLLCPSQFHRDRVRDRFLDRIERVASELLGGLAGVRLEVSDGEGVALTAEPVPGAVGERRADPMDTFEPEPAGFPAPNADAAAPGAEVPEAIPTADESGPRPSRAPVDAVRPPEPPVSGSPPARAAVRPVRRPVQQDFDNFVVGPCNALAREAVLAMARGGQPSLGQIYLSADTGLGKTHLCRAAANEARSGGQRVVYAGAEDFTNDFMTAIRSREVEAFKRRYRHDCDVLIVENVSFFEGKAQTQLEFFHSVRHVLDAGGRVLLTGERLPQRQTGLDDAVRGQLAGGFVAELERPDARVRRDILRAKAAGGGFRIPEDCLDLLVESVVGNVRELEGVLIQLVTTASLLGRPIDLSLTREALAKKFSASADPAAPGPSIAEVIDVVATFFQTSRTAMCSRSRRRDVLVPRQLAMYLCHRYTDASLSEIGRALGRDHPAVRNAVARIERSMLERAPLRYQVESLCERLDERHGPCGRGPEVG